jgi:hypothetical protein
MMFALSSLLKRLCAMLEALNTPMHTAQNTQHSCAVFGNCVWVLGMSRDRITVTFDARKCEENPENEALVHLHCERGSIDANALLRLH